MTWLWLARQCSTLAERQEPAVRGLLRAEMTTLKTRHYNQFNALAHTTCRGHSGPKHGDRYCA
jgi:hypothetical protein